MREIPEEPEDYTPAPTDRFVLALWCDLSLSTGYSINERESTVALLDAFPERVRVVCPRPAFPDTFHDPRIDYVYNHQRHSPLHYPRFVGSQRRRITELVKQCSASAVIFRIGPFPLVAALTIRSGTPVILKGFRGYVPVGPQRKRVGRRVSAVGAEVLYRYISRRCVGADVESPGYAEWLATRFPIGLDRMRIVSNGANTDVFRPGDKQECRRKFGWERFRHVIGYVGAIDSLRCISDLVEAALQLRDIPDLGVVIVGKGPLAEPLQQLVKSAGLEDRVLFPGFLPYHEIPQVISAFDMAVDLTRVAFEVGGRVLFGSYSQKIAQYLACGVPVVAWDTPDTRFLEEEGVGRTVPVTEPPGVAKVLREVVQAQQDGRLHRDQVRAYACRALSTDVIARKRMEYWESLASAR
jgi:glycosyltransferase involved in cell wall biosynthesis